MGAYPGRNAVQFLLAGKQLPEEILRQPNDDPLWNVMAQLGTDAGVAQDFMIDDRHHLYGRALLPITYRATVARDRYAARAEAMLADRLLPYVQYAPSGRLTKFSGEPKYEPEARAEVAMSYLLHAWSDRLGGPVEPVSQEQYFRHFAGVVDYGTGPGLVAHQTERALSGALSKPGFVKFAYLPQHDDWLFDVAGKSPALLPSVDATVQARAAHVYTKARDGLDASATALRTSQGVTGFTTLPDGTVVYATSGTGAGEGVLRLYNLTMPGVPGLDGDRTFSWNGGSTTLAAGLGDGGVDDVRLPATTARYVRMSGTKAATQYGFSLWELEAYAGASANLAKGRPTTASSSSAGFEPAKATDGDPATRWAVATDQRLDPGWLAVDLGRPQQLDRVNLRWETAYASAYDVQVSDDGQTWRTVASVPKKQHANGTWLNVDGRAGFVVRGSGNPITVTPTGVVLSDGPATGAAGMVVEGYPAETTDQTAAHAGTPAPVGGPAGLAASVVGGHLSLFNLTASPITNATVTIPHQGKAITLYEGTQRTAAGSTSYSVSVPAADARVAPARFTISGRNGAEAPAGVTADVAGSATVRLTAPDGAPAELHVTSLTTGEARDVYLTPGGTRTVTFDGPVFPTSDLARDRTTFPTSPRPADMTEPGNAVDGDPATAWRPGATGRMVVDLGSARQIGTVGLDWTTGAVPNVRVDVSTDGLTYVPFSGSPATARYVAVVVTGWQSSQAELRELTVER
ncbi:discoidin domain-containing protein [Flindersiella endophytica]